MICLYKMDESSFTGHGICVLDPTVCTVTEKTGGQYELYMEHPMDSRKKYELIAEKMIIVAPVPHMEVPSITIPATEQIKVTAATDFYKKLPVYKKKSKTEQALATIWQNSNTYLYRPNKYYNPGDYCHNGVNIYQAKVTNQGESVLNTNLWAKVAPFADPGTSSKTYTPGESYSHGLSIDDIVTKIADYNDTYYQIRDALGRIGYFAKESTTVYSTDPETLPAQTIDTQRFRIYRIDSDEMTNIIKVYAKHISYDFQGNRILDCEIVDTEPVNAIANMQGRLMNEDTRRIACNYQSTEDKDYKITKDWSFKNPINALLDADDGLVPALNAKLIRNNDNFYILKNDTVKTGITIEYGVNLLGVTWSRSIETAVTRVVPRCSDGNDEYIYLEHGGTWTDETMETWEANDDIYVDSPIADQFPFPIIEVLDCGFAVGEKYTPSGSATEETRTEESCREEMLKEAQKRFTDDHCDGMEITLTVEFLLMGDTEEYKQYRGLQRVNLYDTITVKTKRYTIPAQVTEYEFDCLTGRYNSIIVGNVSAFDKRVPGYRVVNESITYEKLSPDLIRRIRSLNGLVGDDGSYSPGTPGSTPGSGKNITVDVTDNNPTLAWATESKVASVGGTDIHVTMPPNPASASDNDPTLAWSTRSKVGTVNGIDLHVTMPGNPASSKAEIIVVSNAFQFDNANVTQTISLPSYKGYHLLAAYTNNMATMILGTRYITEYSFDSANGSLSITRSGAGVWAGNNVTLVFIK